MKDANQETNKDTSSTLIEIKNEIKTLSQSVSKNEGRNLILSFV